MSEIKQRIKKIETFINTFTAYFFLNGNKTDRMEDYRSGKF